MKEVFGTGFTSDEDHDERAIFVTRQTELQKLAKIHLKLVVWRTRINCNLYQGYKFCDYMRINVGE